MSTTEEQQHLNDIVNALNEERTRLTAALPGALERSRYLADIVRVPFAGFRAQSDLTYDEANKRRNADQAKLRRAKADVQAIQVRLSQIKLERSAALHEIRQFNPVPRENRSPDDLAYALEVVQELRMAARDAFEVFEECADTHERRAVLETLAHAARKARTFVRLARGSVNDGPDIGVLRESQTAPMATPGPYSSHTRRG